MVLGCAPSSGSAPAVERYPTKPLRFIIPTTPGGGSDLVARIDLPTVAESGVPGYETISWYTILVPGKTPASIVSQLHVESVKAIKSDDMAEMLARRNRDARQHAEEAMDFLKVEIARWAR